MNDTSDFSRKFLFGRQMAPIITGVAIALALTLPVTAIYGGQPIATGAVLATRTTNRSVFTVNAPVVQVSHTVAVVGTIAPTPSVSVNGGSDLTATPSNNQASTTSHVDSVSTVPVNTLNNAAANNNTLLRGSTLGVSVLIGTILSSQQEVTVSLPTVTSLTSNLAIKL